MDRISIGATSAANIVTFRLPSHFPLERQVDGVARQLFQLCLPFAKPICIRQDGDEESAFL